MHFSLCGIKHIRVTTTPVSIDGGEPQEQYSLVLEGYDGSTVTIGEFTKTGLMKALNECLSSLMEDTPVQGEPH